MDIQSKTYILSFALGIAIGLGISALWIIIKALFKEAKEASKGGKDEKRDERPAVNRRGGERRKKESEVIELVEDNKAGG